MAKNRKLLTFAIKKTDNAGQTVHFTGGILKQKIKFWCIFLIIQPSWPQSRRLYYCQNLETRGAKSVTMQKIAPGGQTVCRTGVILKRKSNFWHDFPTRKASQLNPGNFFIAKSEANIPRVTSARVKNTINHSSRFVDGKTLQGIFFMIFSTH